MKRAMTLLSLGIALGTGCSDRDDDTFLPELGQLEAGVQAGPTPGPLDAGSLLDAELGRTPEATTPDAALVDAGPPWGTKLASSGASCKINGVSYASGSKAVPDPRSCNTCTCRDGALVGCSQLACGNACTTGSAFGFSCVRFGVEGCLENEFGCRPACSGDETCAAPATCDREQGVCSYRFSVN